VTLPNGAGDHRAPRTPPWRGAVRLRAPYEPPPHGPRITAYTAGSFSMRTILLHVHVPPI
jgi:hypothetical protein